jgi:hypothetical protein
VIDDSVPLALKWPAHPMEILANFALAINAPQNRGGLLVAAGHTVSFLRDAEIVFSIPPPHLNARVT